jgi:hypothetical protein
MYVVVGALALLILVASLLSRRHDDKIILSLRPIGLDRGARARPRGGRRATLHGVNVRT